MSRFDSYIVGRRPCSGEALMNEAQDRENADAAYTDALDDLLSEAREEICRDDEGFAAVAESLCTDPRTATALRMAGNGDMTLIIAMVEAATVLECDAVARRKLKEVWRG